MNGEPNLSTAERGIYMLLGLGLAAAAARPRPNPLLNVLALAGGSYLAWRGYVGNCPVKAAITGGHGFGGVTSNVYQMPGAFLVKDGRVIREFRHQSPSDRPDYSELACPI